MLREYHLENFKAFAGPETIPIRPITLIYGPNSSGKSSILQSLLLLKQTLEEADSSTPLLPKGKLVDLGNYREFIHRHEVSREFSFKVLFSPDFFSSNSKQMLPYWLHQGWFPMGLKVRFTCEEEARSVSFFQVDIFVGDESLPVISYNTVRFPDEQMMTLTKIYPKHEYWREWWIGVKRYIRQELDRGEVESVFHKNDLEYEPFTDFRQDLENYPLEKALEDLQEESWLSPIDYRTFLPVGKRAEFLGSKRLEQLIQKATALDAASPEIKCELLEQLSKQIEQLERRKQSNQGFSSIDPQEGSPEESPFVVDLNYYSINAPRREQAFSWDRLNMLPLTSHVCSVFRHLVEDMIHLGPLRNYPERHYVFGGDISEGVGRSGERMPDILFKNPELVNLVNAELDRLGFGYELKMSTLRDEDSNHSNVFALRVVDKQTDVSANVQDIGFGFSQVLPIIVQSLLSQNKTLLIEQPEIHLHPALQAELGDLFIKSALGEQKNTFILETHSEHLLLRIMRRMRETANGTLPAGIPPVRPEDVAVLYVERDEQQSIVREMPLNERGELVKAWPGGFFEEGLREVLPTYDR